MAPHNLGWFSTTVGTDLWAAGVTFFELLTARLPFESAQGFNWGIGPLPSARAIDPSLPEQVEQVLARALHRLSSSRFQTADQFAVSIGALLAIEGSSARPTPRPKTS